MAISFLFICLANVCRSPAAESIFRRFAQKRGIDARIVSCGLGSFHLGHQADSRMADAARLRGYSIVTTAKQFQPNYFDEFDYLIALDHEILQELYLTSKTTEQKAKIHLLTHFSDTYKDQDVPDPYYAGESGFEQVLDIIEDSCLGLLDSLEEKEI